MTEPFVTTEYGVPPCSLGNRRARRGSVSQNITHTAVGFMSKQWCTPFLPSSFSLSSSSTLYLFPPPPPCTTLPLLCDSLAFCATSTPPPSTLAIQSITIPFSFFTSHHHPCYLQGKRRPLVLHHSYPGKKWRRSRRGSACTPKIQSNT